MRRAFLIGIAGIALTLASCRDDSVRLSDTVYLSWSNDSFLTSLNAHQQWHALLDAAREDPTIIGSKRWDERVTLIPARFRQILLDAREIDPPDERDAEHDAWLERLECFDVATRVMDDVTEDLEAFVASLYRQSEGGGGADAPTVALNACG